MVMPGTYKVGLKLWHEGELKTLVEPLEFTCKKLNNTTLPAADYTESDFSALIPVTPIHHHHHHTNTNTNRVIDTSIQTPSMSELSSLHSISAIDSSMPEALQSSLTLSDETF